MIHVRVRSALAGIFLLACGPAGQDEAAPMAGRVDEESSGMGVESPPEPPGRGPLLRELYEYGLSFGETRADLLASLGPPDSTWIHSSPNPYLEAMDSLFHLTYDGMQLWLLRSGYDGREFAVNVHLTDSRRRLPGGFQPGITSRHALYGRLGNPDAQHQMGDTIVWGYLPFPGDAEEYVQFYLVSDSLRKIRWALYVD